MCGIAGIFNPGHPYTDKDSLNALVLKMASSMGHRGPDDAGSWVSEDAALAMGHRRLAVIDTSVKGHQPMHSHSGRYALVYNGEIYNHREIRRALEKRGCPFDGHSDTEVFLAAIEQWGPLAALGRITGMFAFALWDKRERCLYLARDRIGEKPLYYGHFANTLLFGSELKALEAAAIGERVIDREALHLFTRFNYVPAPYSIYKNVYKLKPATCLTVRLSNQALSFDEVVYWSLRDAVSVGRENRLQDEHEMIAGLESRLADSVRRQMVADVPVGAFLSGGIDSSTIASVMQRCSTAPIKTYTIGFDEKGFNEAEIAKRVAKHLGTDHTELYVTADEALEVIPTLPGVYDEPFADSSQIPTLLVSRLASADVKVSLSGDGGDELFGGYNRHHLGNVVWKRIQALPGSLQQALVSLLRGLSSKKATHLLTVLYYLLPRRIKSAEMAHKLTKLADVAGLREPQAMYATLVTFWREYESIVLDMPEETGDISCGQWDWDDRMDMRENMMLLDMTDYLPNDILTKVDRATMSVSLESRIPFLDHQLVEYVWKIPVSHKIRHGKGKWILRKILDRHVPAKITDRAKMGFGVPLDSWLRGPLKEWGRALIADGENRDYFDSAKIIKKWDEHQRGTGNWQYDLWGVLMFYAWCESRSF